MGESIVGHSELTDVEKARLEVMDSRMYGSIRLDEPENLHDVVIIQKGIRMLESQILEKSKTKQEPGTERERQKSLNQQLANVYLKLGHLQFLAEDFRKALSAYQIYGEEVADAWKSPAFLYGLGLTYYHFRALDMANECLRKLVYTYPNFDRVNEAHLVLGLIFKQQNNWRLALKHLNAALCDDRPCSLSALHIRYEIATCHDLSGDSNRAKELYETILNSCAGAGPVAQEQAGQGSARLKAAVLRQLGWLLYRTADASPCAVSGVDNADANRTARLQQAIGLLNEAVRSEPADGRAFYYLGRCFANLTNGAHEAFRYYRTSIDKCEADADTWCSIGVLYKAQQQPMDALQAFVCAVQLDSAHAAAWQDLGLLYEHFGQFEDAVQCYSRAAQQQQKSADGAGFTSEADALVARIAILKSELAKAPQQPQGGAGQRVQLPRLADAQRLPIPSELMQRLEKMWKQKQERYESGSQLLKYDLSTEMDATGRPHQPAFYLNTEQIQMMHILQQNQAQLSTEQSAMLSHLAQSYSMMQQHLKLVDKLRQATQPPVAADGMHADVKLPPSDGDNVNAAAAANDYELPEVSEEDLLNVLGDSRPASGGHARDPNRKDDLMLGQAAQLLSGPSTSHQHHASDDSTTAPAAASVAVNIVPGVGGTVPADTSAGAQATAGIGAASWETSADKGDMGATPAKPVLPPALNLLAPLHVHPSCRAADILAVCERRGTANHNQLACSVFDEHAPPPEPPEPPATTHKGDELLLPTPTVVVDSKKDAAAIELQQFVYRAPTALVKGLTTALRVDLSYFSTKTLLEVAPEFEVEVRTQLKQRPDTNTDALGNETWKCDSNRTFTTIAKYAQYQAQTFQQSLKEEQERVRAGGPKDWDPFSRPSTLTRPDGRRRTLKFGTNIDLSDERRWRTQLAELHKLPSWARLHSAANMLTHLGHTVFGMNTVQLYMKVPGCRTPGHRENNNFASVNVNIGPGECEWFCVDDSYWGVIERLLHERGLDFLKGSWWPILRDLSAAGVPLYRFTQRAGDLVWVGPGTIHWVQATGWCNAVAWNVGPCSVAQLGRALLAYEWNKLQGYKSIVPMVHLCWQLAKNIQFTRVKLHELLRGVLVRSLAHCKMTLDYVHRHGRKAQHQPRQIGEPAHYCHVCEIGTSTPSKPPDSLLSRVITVQHEVFNVLLVQEQPRGSGKYVVHCVTCAARLESTLDGFSVLVQYPLEELCRTLDQCVLHQTKPSLIC